MIYNLRQIEERLLKEHYNKVIKKINECHKNNVMFKGIDLIGEEDTYYYTYMTKGILLTLLDREYIKIVGSYGNKNYMYQAIKEIKLKYG